MSEQKPMRLSDMTPEQMRGWFEEIIDRASARQALADAACTREGHQWHWLIVKGERAGSLHRGWWYGCDRCHEVGQSHTLPSPATE